MRAILFGISVLVFAAQAAAGDMNITVTDAAGDPVANTVVLVEGVAGAKAPDSFEWPNMMEQKDIQFAPYVLIAPKGSDVKFPNRDRVRHHVYSFAKGNRFELKLYGMDEDRAVKLKKAGKVAVGCNIHDGMIGYIRVVDTPYAVKTDAEGKAVLKGLPGDAGEMTFWHPDMNNGKDMTVAYGADQKDISVSFGAKKAGHSGHDH